MESKFYLAYHKDYPQPHSKCLIPHDVRKSNLDSNYFCELSMIDNILNDESLHAPFMGVGHYRRMFQSEAFQNTDIIPFLFGKEYGKESRPTLQFTSDHHKAITSDFKLDLGQSDMLVLDTFRKSRKKALYTLVDIGWLDKVAVDYFYYFLEVYYHIPKEEFDIIYHHTMESTEHYCNNIMYSNKETFIDYWSYIMNIITTFANMMGMKHPNHITPRMYGYFAEYLMKPTTIILGLKIKEVKSICLEQ